jgi:hypothetical protein
MLHQATRNHEDVKRIVELGACAIDRSVCAA